MGAYSPAPVMTEEMTKRTMDEIVRPTLRAMSEMGAPYQGVLFAGLMITREGPKLIEYNVRFGDPECQVLMLRLKSDLVPALHRRARRRAEEFRSALVRRGRADRRDGGEGLSRRLRARARRSRAWTDAAAVDGVEIFHAGTARRADGRLVANGGRVLNVSAIGKTVAEAQARAYAAVDQIDWPDGFCRRDIGWRAVARDTRA